MNMPSQRGLTAVAVCLIGLSAAGCIDTPKGGLSYMNPLYRDAPIDSAYGPTPDQQIATLRRTARSAKRLSAQQQSQTSGKLVSQLQNEVDPLIRVEIVRTLSVFPTAAAAYGMKQAIEDNNVKVRVAACEGWANLRGDEAINVLAEKLASSTEDDVRLAAARALGKFRGSEAAVQALAVVLDDANPAIQTRAMASMGAVSGKPYGDDVVAWREFSQGGTPTSRGDTSVARQFFGWWR